MQWCYSPFFEMDIIRIQYKDKIKGLYPTVGLASFTSGLAPSVRGQALSTNEARPQANEDSPLLGG